MMSKNPFAIFMDQDTDGLWALEIKDLGRNLTVWKTATTRGQLLTLLKTAPTLILRHIEEQKDWMIPSDFRVVVLRATRELERFLAPKPKENNGDAGS